MNRRRQALKYILFDLLAATAAWFLFFRYRKLNLDPPPFGYRQPELESLYSDTNFIKGLIIIPICWILFYAFSGSYSRIYKKHRIKEVIQTVAPTIIGCLIIFFALILDDQIATYRDYYTAFFILFGLQCGITLLFRLLLTSRTIRRINRKEIGFNTLIVGGGQSAIEVFSEIDSMPKSPGYYFKGFVNLLAGPHPLKEHGLEHLGSFDEVLSIVKEKEIEEVIIALDQKEQKSMGMIMNTLDGHGITLKVIPDMYDILSGSVKMTSIYGTPLIEIDQEIMPVWQMVLKRVMDVAISIFMLVLLFPMYVIIALVVK
jgi:FlaA1/EpsC-like NDP-sugar epimerase